MTKKNMDKLHRAADCFSIFQFFVCLFSPNSAKTIRETQKENWFVITYGSGPDGNMKIKMPTVAS